MTKIAKIDTLFMTETLPFEAAHTYITHIREYPLPHALAMLCVRVGEY